MEYFVGPTFGEITIFGDKCSLQNKNNVVICYILWLVDTSFFSCNFDIFVQVNTNNASDIPLNLLNCVYQKRDIFIYK